VEKKLLHTARAFDNLELIGKCMKIQEMRPGVLQLNRRLEEVRQEVFFDEPADQEQPPADEPAPVISSELDEPCWSVVSFDRREAAGLSYDQAFDLVSALDGRGIAGLCIVTDEAARRLKS
jgi:hypothetical protein